MYLCEIYLEVVVRELLGCICVRFIWMYLWRFIWMFLWRYTWMYLCEIYLDVFV